MRLWCGLFRSFGARLFNSLTRGLRPGLYLAPLRGSALTTVAKYRASLLLMQGREDSRAIVTNSNHSTPWTHSIFYIVLIAFLLRLAVITIGHTYRITPRRDHFQYGWEMGRIARSIVLGQGFSSPTDLPTGPSAWAPPVYPYILAGVFKLFGIYSNLSAWIILAFNSIFSALTCLTLYRIAEKIYGVAVARATAWTWALFPYAIYYPVRVVWEMSLSAFLLSLALLLTLRMADAPPRVHAPGLRSDFYGACWRSPTPQCCPSCHFACSICYGVRLVPFASLSDRSYAFWSQAWLSLHG